MSFLEELELAYDESMMLYRLKSHVVERDNDGNFLIYELYYDRSQHITVLGVKRLSSFVQTATNNIRLNNLTFFKTQQGLS